MVAVVSVLAIWAAYAFAQEAYIGHRLAQMAGDLRSTNARLAAENSGYHKDVQAVTSGAANEEEARLNGYSRPYERLYLVTVPPSPTPATPAPTPGP